MVVAYHSACSMQHGQKIKTPPRSLLARRGFQIRDVPEGHLCCGSAGIYNLLQPEIAGQLRDRKVRQHREHEAAGDRGGQYRLHDPDRLGARRIPIVHTVELLDWATGGPMPEAIAKTRASLPAA